MAALLLLFFFSTASAFSTQRPLFYASRSRRLALHSSAGVDANEASHPALSRDEVESWLNNVPVYAVTQEDGGLVLLSEEGNSNNIAYFFFNPGTANDTFKKLKVKEGADWDIKGFSLGDIWFELLSSGRPSVKDGVEFRLVPDVTELEKARMLLTQRSQQSGGEVPAIFQAAYDEVPVFLDQRLRLEIDGEEKFPMYFGLQDLVATVQQGLGASSESEVEAVINVADLRGIVEQMQGASEVDYRMTVLFAPTPQTPPVGGGVGKEAAAADDDEPISLSTTNDWSD